MVVGVFVFSYSMETLDVQAEKLSAKEETIYQAPFPDYSISGFENGLGNILLGIGSTLTIFCVTMGIALLLKKPRKR